MSPLDGKKAFPVVVLLMLIDAICILRALIALGFHNTFQPLLFHTRGFGWILLINFHSLVWLSLPWYLRKLARQGVKYTTLLFLSFMGLLITVPCVLLFLLIPDYNCFHGAAVALQHAVFVMKAHSLFLFDHTKDVPFGRFVWFIFAPTVVFKEHFERLDKTDWLNVARYFLGMCMAYGTVYIILIFHILPVIESGYSPATTWLKLIFPCCPLFLNAFYSTFHCFMNLFAELTRFAERDFYREWWCAADFSDWIKEWNVIVQTWLSALFKLLYRHSGRSKAQCALASLLISALGHEYIMLIIFRQLSFWVMLFMGGILGAAQQLAHTKFGHTIRTTPLGNFLVVTGLFLGFPVAVQLYCACKLRVPGPICLPHHVLRF